MMQVVGDVQTEEIDEWSHADIKVDLRYKFAKLWYEGGVDRIEFGRNIA